MNKDTENQGEQNSLPQILIHSPTEDSEPAIEYISADPLNRDPEELIQKTLEVFGSSMSSISEDLENKETSKESSQLELIPVSIQLLNTDKEIKNLSTEECAFWVGACEKGFLSPSSLLNISDVTDIFDVVADEGIEGGGPLLLTDTDFLPPRLMYFSENNDNWVKDTTNAIKPWAPKAIGIYLAPSIFNDLKTTILQEIIESLTISLGVRSFYLISDNNAVLNTAHSARMLLKDSGFDVTVRH